MRSRSLTALAAALFLTAPLHAQSVDADPALSWDDFPGQAGRPHAPWIFRCTLEQRPRMLILALAPECWVAYDAQGCRFDTAWSGGMEFNGSVYTGAHGPNPSVKGDVTLAGPTAAFATTVKGVTTDVTPAWKGYRIEDGHAVLMSEVALGGSTVQISERPEVVRDKDGVWFERTFEVNDLKPATPLSVRVPLVRPDGAVLTVHVNGAPLVATSDETESLVPIAATGTTVIRSVVADSPAAPAVKGGAK